MNKVNMFLYRAGLIAAIATAHYAEVSELQNAIVFVTWVMAVFMVIGVCSCAQDKEQLAKYDDQFKKYPSVPTWAKGLTVITLALLIVIGWFFTALAFTLTVLSHGRLRMMWAGHRGNCE